MAADQNYAPAQFQLGCCYLLSQGLPKNEAEGVKWLRKAADQNYAEAQYTLGVCYRNGGGVAKDYVEAFAWLDLAAGRLESAAGTRDSLEKMLFPDQVPEAQKRAKELRAEIEARGNSDKK
jgi:TPR repeat protein